MTNRPQNRKYRAYRSGIWAERLVSCWLFLLGYQILARRLRTPVAEIDILARHRFVERACLVVFEVKYRRRLQDALQALRPKQKQRLMRAGLWLQSSGYMKEGESLRWDYIAFAWGHFPRHLRNIAMVGLK